MCHFLNVVYGAVVKWRPCVSEVNARQPLALKRICNQMSELPGGGSMRGNKGFVDIFWLL